MFERIKYRKEYETLTPTQRNESLRTIFDAVPINTPVFQLKDLSPIEKYWGFKLDQEALSNQHYVYDMYTQAVQEQRRNSNERKVLARKLDALMRFVHVSPFYKKLIKDNFEHYYEWGVYQEYPLS